MNQIHAKKSLGQNFLIHHGTLQKIIQAADLKPSDHVVEVGPGQGVLTNELAKQAAQVTAIELDDRLIPILHTLFDGTKNIKILHCDTLDFTPPSTPYKVVANIPYYITSPLLNHFLRDQPDTLRPQHIVLLVQREVAQKICAKEGDLSVLAIQVQLFGTPKLIAKVPASHFSPAPKVDSAILQITMHPPLLPDQDLMSFFKMIHASFIHKRKKLIRNLGAIQAPKTVKEIFEKLGLHENARAQELSLKTWIQLHTELINARKP